MICWDHWIKKRGNYLSCLEGKGDLKDTAVLHKMPRCLFIYNKISFFLPVLSNNTVYSKELWVISCELNNFCLFLNVRNKERFITVIRRKKGVGSHFQGFLMHKIYLTPNFVKNIYNIKYTLKKIKQKKLSISFNVIL